MFCLVGVFSCFNRRVGQRASVAIYLHLGCQYGLSLKNKGGIFAWLDNTTSKV